MLNFYKIYLFTEMHYVLIMWDILTMTAHTFSRLTGVSGANIGGRLERLFAAQGTSGV
jgi:hypothetical protein